ncbi:MAG: WYL domain-containing protein [Streptosporangiaceae bacterium]
MHAYGIVGHSGRWYVAGADSASGEVRTFRLDRIETATVLPGSFEIPAGFDPAGRPGTVRARRGALPARGVATGPGHGRAGPRPAPGRDRHRAGAPGRPGAGTRRAGSP